MKTQEATTMTLAEIREEIAQRRNLRRRPNISEFRTGSTVLTTWHHGRISRDHTTHVFQPYK